MNKLPLFKQEGALKSYFPNSRVQRKGNSELSWIHILQPTPLSNSYKVELVYTRSNGVKMFVLEPKPLPLAKGWSVLPHVYSTSEQRLCLYYPKDREWNSSMLFVKTIIPWTSEWLLHYEIWVGTGNWKGGGIHHETEAEKEAD